MVEEVIKTGVDELLELLKNSPKVPLADVAKKLNASIDVVQAWVDFLVEEGIVGIEYKFTTPFIYMNRPIESKTVTHQPIAPQEMNLQTFKTLFWTRAMKNNINADKIGELWRNHISQALELKKKYFYFEARNRKIITIDPLWQEYVNKCLTS